MPKKRLKMNKVAGPGVITQSNLEAQIGPVSTAVLTTEHKMHAGKRKRKDSVIPTVVVKSVHNALDSIIESLNKISKR